jgi:Domain of unknown function (DUF4404)
MDQNNLHEHLAKLRADLANAPQANPVSKQSLADAMKDAAANPQDQTMPDRLEKLAVQFEADHPNLAAGARRLVELLAEVGI